MAFLRGSNFDLSSHYLLLARGILIIIIYIIVVRSLTNIMVSWVLYGMEGLGLWKGLKSK